MHLILFTGIFNQLEVHGHEGFDASQGDFGGLPDEGQRAEVVKLPALVVKRGQVQHRIAVIRNRHLKKKRTNKKKKKAALSQM